MTNERQEEFRPSGQDALIVVDVQKDFLPGGALGIRYGDEVVPILDAWVRTFTLAGRPVIATRDWHPPNHCSFSKQGGPWPPHCIAGAPGAEFADALHLPATAILISKATTPDRDAYSGFAGTDLGAKLAELNVRRVFVGGLATDYCVLNTVLDARAAGLDVVVLEDAIRAVNVKPDDGTRALERMKQSGAELRVAAAATD